MVEYRHRIIDNQFDIRMESMGATLIVGPKGCGKTTTAKQKAQTIIEFQDEDNRERYLDLAMNRPSRLLSGKKPILFDEWQDAPKLWGAIRKDVDDTGLSGQYILTGSSSKNIKTPHSGTLRISTLRMHPMSLYESGESNGSISMGSLFDGKYGEGIDSASKMTIDDIIFAICRGGWPRAINNRTPRSQLFIAQDLFRQTCHSDISTIDDKKRNPQYAEMIMRSYARNICQLTDYKKMYADASSDNDMGEATFYEYLDALRRLYIVEDVDAWCPAIRSKTAIRASKKKNLVDPSLAVAAFGIGPEALQDDWKTLGFLFESMVIRDLKVYSYEHDGRVSYYRDRYGLESDVVLHMGNGKYALIEVKLGHREIEEGAKHLNKIEELIRIHNEEEDQVPLREPDLKIVITGTDYGYTRDDGVHVIPIGCLRD